MPPSTSTTDYTMRDDLYHLPLYSPTSSNDDDDFDAFSVSSSPPESPWVSSSSSSSDSEHHQCRHPRSHSRPWTRIFRSRTLTSTTSNKLNLIRIRLFPIPSHAYIPRKMYSAMLMVVVVVFMLFCGTFLRMPMGSLKMVKASKGVMNATITTTTTTTTLAGNPNNPSHHSAKDRTRRPATHSNSNSRHRQSQLNPALRLTPSLELASITSFLTSLHDHQTNILPPTIDPTKPINPDLVLGFDIKRNPRHAKEELRVMQEEVWGVNPIVLYAKRYSPLTRAIKGVLDSLWMNPPPTYIDVDTRADEEVLVPLLKRITGLELPILLIGGEPIRPPHSYADNTHMKFILDAQSNTGSNELFDTSLLEYVQEMEKNGGLDELLEVAGVVAMKQRD